MGDTIDIGEGLVITVVSMLVVFAVLILISFLIGLLRSFSEGKKKELPAKVTAVVEEAPTTEPVIEENSEELVAVISAAIAASLGLNIPEINIKSIRRVSQNNNPWLDMGKKEQLFGKL